MLPGIRPDMANVTYNQPGPDQWDNAAMMKQGAPPGSAWDGTDQGSKVGDKSKGKMGRPKGAKDTKPRCINQWLRYCSCLPCVPQDEKEQTSAGSST